MLINKNANSSVAKNLELRLIWNTYYVVSVKTAFLVIQIIYLLRTYVIHNTHAEGLVKTVFEKYYLPYEAL